MSSKLGWRKETRKKKFWKWQYRNQNPCLYINKWKNKWGKKEIKRNFKYWFHIMFFPLKWNQKPEKQLNIPQHTQEVLQEFQSIWWLLECNLIGSFRNTLSCCCVFLLKEMINLTRFIQSYIKWTQVGKKDTAGEKNNIIIRDDKVRGYVLQTIRFSVQCLANRDKPGIFECKSHQETNFTNTVVHSFLLQQLNIWREIKI